MGQEAPHWSAPPRHPSAAAAPGTPVVGALVYREITLTKNVKGFEGKRRRAAADQSGTRPPHSKEVDLTLDYSHSIVLGGLELMS